MHIPHLRNWTARVLGGFVNSWQLKVLFEGIGFGMKAVITTAECVAGE